jgi:hypothetical protein
MLFGACLFVGLLVSAPCRLRRRRLLSTLPLQALSSLLLIISTPQSRFPSPCLSSPSVVVVAVAVIVVVVGVVLVVVVVVIVVIVGVVVVVVIVVVIVFVVVDIPVGGLLSLGFMLSYI